jgi:hypothetical protein
MDHRKVTTADGSVAAVATTRTGTCESCGRDGEVLHAVHRVYVTPETWETEAASRRMDEIEQWCFSCCSHYPHEPAHDPTGPGGT